MWTTNKPNTKKSLEIVSREKLNEEIPEEVHAVDDDLDDEGWLDLQIAEHKYNKAF